MADETTVVAEETAAPKEYAQKILDIAENLVGLTILEANELVEVFKDKYGIEPAAGGGVVMAAAAPGAAEAEEEVEPDSWKVVLKSFGEKKIQVIKAVRAETSLALKEAKAVVEDVPSTIKENLDKEAAEKCVETLKEAGADAEIQPE